MSSATVDAATLIAFLVCDLAVCANATGLSHAGEASANAPMPQRLRTSRRRIGSDVMARPLRKRLPPIGEDTKQSRRLRTRRSEVHSVCNWDRFNLKTKITRIVFSAEDRKSVV